MSEPENSLAPSCLDDTEPDFISVEHARQQIKNHITPLRVAELCELRAALNRVLAKDIYSPLNIPPHANSAMDGFAISVTKPISEGEQQYQEIGTAFAGQPFQGTVNAGECVRIMTGAWIPAGTNSVIIQERCRAANQAVQHHDAITPGQNVRLAGEDLQQDQLALAAGIRLMPAELGLLGALGKQEVPVVIPPKVCYFSTGNELRNSGQTLDAGAIYDSNRYTVFAMLKRLGIEVFDLGAVADDPEQLQHAFETAVANHDIVITSGGVSVSEADYIKPTLSKLGKNKFWKVAIRPGRPFTFGTVKEKLFFGLPGNPVAVMVMFYQLIQPALKYMLGEPDEKPLLVKAISKSRIRKRPGRMEFQRGIYTRLPNGSYEVRKTDNQGSGILSSMTQGNCFIVLEDSATPLKVGDMVNIQPFCSLL